MKEFPPVTPLNWCGVPIRPGEGYGGRSENIPNRTLCPISADAKQHQHFEVITEQHMVEVFGNGTYKLPRAEAAKRLELLTGTHRTSCYRVLRLNGRFSQHLRSDGTTLSWRSL